MSRRRLATVPSPAGVCRHREQRRRGRARHLHFSRRQGVRRLGLLQHPDMRSDENGGHHLLAGAPTGEPQEGNCWTSSLAVWREDAWRCIAGNAIYDPCFSTDESVICGANPNAPTTSFLLLLTEPLPAPEVPQDTTGTPGRLSWPMGQCASMLPAPRAGLPESASTTSAQSEPRPSRGDPGRPPGGITLDGPSSSVTGDMPDLTVLESAEVPLRTVWR